MEIKPKICVICEKEFIPYRTTQKVCSNNCAIKDAKIKVAKKEKVKGKKEVMTLAEYLKLAQSIFNQYINLRDKGLPCISCGCEVKAPNASHFFSVGSTPELRFNELNVHTSCIRCNLYLHGNILEYAIRLPKRIGQENYELLVSLRNIPRKYTIEELKDLIKEYRQKIKILKNT
jgi:hypothetical protein